MSTRADYTFLRRIVRRKPRRTVLSALIDEIERAFRFPDGSRATVGMCERFMLTGRRVPFDAAARLRGLRPELGFIDVDVAMFEPDEEQPYFETETPVLFVPVDKRFNRQKIDPSRAQEIAHALGG